MVASVNAMLIDVVAVPGPHTAPRVQSYRRWTGICRACGLLVRPGEYVTWVPQEPVVSVRTYRMAIVHVDCVTIPMRFAGRSCTPDEFARVMALAGQRN